MFAPQPPSSPRPTFIASGGARGITAQCVIRLARSLPSHWVLLGRSALMADEPVWAKDCRDEVELKQRILQNLATKGEKATPAAVNKICRSLTASREIASTLQTLRDMGCEATYLSADVTDSDALKAGLALIIDRFGPVTGIIHGAGNLADKLIEKKSEQDFERVYGPKVVGLRNLLNCVSTHQLKYLVLFSSVAGFYGNAGQTDYALANEILNKTALWIKQQYPTCHAVAIDSGPWESGMVTPALKAAFEARGVDILPIEDATQMLVNELNPAYAETAQVVIGSPIPSPLAVIEGGLKTHLLRRKLTLVANPFLQDHVIAGSPVLPFTCLMGWIARAAEQLYPGYHSFLCKNVRLLKGIVFDQQVVEDYVLELKEIAKSKSEIVVEGKIRSQTAAGKPRYHFSNQVTLRPQRPDRPALFPADLTLDRKITARSSDFYQDIATYGLFHGPSFSGVSRILNISETRMTTEHQIRKISARQQGQFPIQTLNPYTTDLQLHPVLIWLKHFYRATCLPCRVERYEIFDSPPYNRPFYTTTEIVAKTQSSLTVNIIAHDEQGNVYTSIKGGGSTIFSAKRQVA